MKNAIWKSRYMSQRLFDNDFYVSFLSWLNDYIKSKYGSNSRLLFSLLIACCMKLKPKLLIKILVNIMKWFDFTNYLAKSKYYDYLNISVVCKMNKEA